MQTDGYDGCLAVVSQPDVEHLACWSHARRKFIEAGKVGGKTAKADVAVV